MPKNSSEGPLEDLGERLKQARRTQQGPPSKGPRLQGETTGKMVGLGAALRIGAELVSTLIVGVAIGWFLDTWLGTKPWLMIVFIFLGGAAGILNVYRFALRMEAETTVETHKTK